MSASKSSLAVALSKLKLFSKPDVKLEQYPTDSEIAAEILWNAHMRGDLDNKIVADLGCGTGILGIGALLLGAKKVFFVDIDKNALEILKQNLDDLDANESIYEIINKYVSNVSLDYVSDCVKGKLDVVFQNPPFGTKEEHADKMFLEKAFELSDTVYSFHKLSTEKFVNAITRDHNFRITEKWIFKFPLKQTQKFHKKRIEHIDVGCWRLER
ncbi:methyltransferase [Candidatus Woesearchaeota archaeon]|jgi:putative methylase|nr:methyltransferase [Candidatus Woesearchaeota archaeon]MBT6519821.1 methyltransferase [Candidatus Woesearchaeota archaeon]MBT7368200.1 methyltransferase [Candidatus Woesearchaeota archaeon]